jgi:hypothetical protein
MQGEDRGQHGVEIGQLQGGFDWRHVVEVRTWLDIAAGSFDKPVAQFGMGCGLAGKIGITIAGARLPFALGIALQGGFVGPVGVRLELWHGLRRRYGLGRLCRPRRGKRVAAGRGPHDLVGMKRSSKAALPGISARIWPTVIEGSSASSNASKIRWRKMPSG